MSIVDKISFCEFVKTRPYYERFCSGFLSRGLFLVQFLQDYIEEFDKVALVVLDVSLLQCSFDRFDFRPVCFLVNLLRMGFFA